MVENRIENIFDDVFITYYDLYLQADGVIYPNENASYYFANMGQLEILNNLEGLDTSNVVNMSYMFYNCGYTGSDKTPVTIIDVSKWDTSNVTDMSYMFSYAFSLTGLDLNNFNTSNVTTMKAMFQSVHISQYSVSNFDTSNVMDMSNMFYGNYISSPEFVLTIKNPSSVLYDCMFCSFMTSDSSRARLNYTLENAELAKNMVATNDGIADLDVGNCVDCGNNFLVGTEINISGERFNVISQTDDTVTMLAQYNLGTDYRQSTIFNGVMFADEIGWENTPGPKEIDIKKWSTNPNTYVNEYVTYLQGETGDTTLTGDLITMKELGLLGCVITNDYKNSSDVGCHDSIYKKWLLNGQFWWTHSASAESPYFIWYLQGDGTVDNYVFSQGYGVRPVITISKKTLLNIES